MNIISNINLKKFFVIALTIFLLFPAEVAVPKNNINITKNYIICKISTSTDVDYDVLYDSQGRNITDIKVENRIINILTKAKTPFFDPYANLNKYIIYTDSDDVTNTTLNLSGLYRAKILYPINREKYNNFIFRKCLFWLEAII